MIPKEDKETPGRMNKTKCKQEGSGIVLYNPRLVTAETALFKDLFFKNLKCSLRNYGVASLREVKVPSVSAVPPETCSFAAWIYPPVSLFLRTMN